MSWVSFLSVYGSNIYIKVKRDPIIKWCFRYVSSPWPVPGQAVGPDRDPHLPLPESGFFDVHGIAELAGDLV